MSELNSEQYQINLALGLVRQAALQIRCLRERIVATDKQDARINSVLDIGIYLSHAEVALEDLAVANPELTSVSVDPI
jgi:hypothetical protein